MMHADIVSSRGEVKEYGESRIGGGGANLA